MTPFGTLDDFWFLVMFSILHPAHEMRLKISVIYYSRWYVLVPWLLCLHSINKHLTNVTVTFSACQWFILKANKGIRLLHVDSLTYPHQKSDFISLSFGTFIASSLAVLDILFIIKSNRFSSIHSLLAWRLDTSSLFSWRSEFGRPIIRLSFTSLYNDKIYVFSTNNWVY